jgi:hypothetical protein
MSLFISGDSGQDQRQIKLAGPGNLPIAHAAGLMLRLPRRVVSLEYMPGLQLPPLDSAPRDHIHLLEKCG